MSEAFPSEAYRKLCIENEKKLREECKDPQVGDWFAHWAGDKWIALCWTGEYALCLDDVIPLPTQRQLQTMLEERGCHHIHMAKSPQNVAIRTTKGEGQKDIYGYGPDPETAFLRAVLAAMQHTIPTQGKENEMSHRDSEGQKLVAETVQSIFFALDYITEAGDDGAERYRLATWWAEHIITRISQAIADGELMLTKVPPKLPGEVGRDVVEATWVDDYLDAGIKVKGDLLPTLKRGDIIIALSPFPRDPLGTGTGKEEEK